MSPDSSLRRPASLPAVPLFAVAALCLVAFGLDAYMAFSGAAAASNQSTELALHAHAASLFDHGARIISLLFSPAAGLVWAALLAFGLYLGRFRLDAFTLLVAIVGDDALGFVLKRIFKEPRPHLFTPLVKAHGYGFPSGHSILSTALFGFFAVWLVAQAPRDAWRYLVAVLLGIAIGVVCVSRVYAGVHWPTDVIGGATLSAGWLFACLGAEQMLARRA